MNVYLAFYRYFPIHESGVTFNSVALTVRSPLVGAVGDRQQGIPTRRNAIGEAVVPGKDLK